MQRLDVVYDLAVITIVNSDNAIALSGTQKIPVLIKTELPLNSSTIDVF